MPPRLVLKKGKERPILQGHQWIYSGAIASMEAKEAGSLVEVVSATGEVLGLAFSQGRHSIAATMIARSGESVEEALERKIRAAVSMRRQLFDPEETTGYRLIHAEGDEIPGLIIDDYAGVGVMQISSEGLEPYRPLIVDLLRCYCKTLYEKSTTFLRKQKGLEEARGYKFGEEISEVEILEKGLRYLVSITEGQKTGFFLDQREMRHLVFQISKGKRVLNVFAYTGGFSVAAMAGGAKKVDSVEISGKCRPYLERNFELNGLPNGTFYEEDAFDFLANDPLDYDLVILDPPAFVKKREDIDQAFRAYKELNRAVMAKVKKGTLLLTCSCSYHVGEELFGNILFRSALEAGVDAKILSRHRLALDHPISIYHPETNYLSSRLLRVS
jgi:23S rRNA (cytosine1962-C5)-methyltransferase